jgi:hypothetical protein
LLLAVTDHVVSAPRVATADDVELMPDGSVRLRVRRGAGAGGEGAEQSVRRLLARALEVSSSVGPALRRAAERRDDAGLATLVRELETALIPVNRSAARRALSRLHRETERAKAAGKLDKLLQLEHEASAAPAAAPAAPSAPAAVARAPVEPASEPIVAAADFPEPSPVPLPAVVAAPLPAPAPAPAARPAARAELTPEPLLAAGEPALTKPEPVVLRAKERGSSTPRLGTLVTAQTLPGEEGEHTVRAPGVAFEEEPELDLSIDVELEPEAPQQAAAPQQLVDPEPSRMPDVLLAMVQLHAGIEADEAPTRIRDVVTELRPAAVLTPEPEMVDDAWLTQSSLDGVVTSAKLFESERVEAALHEAVTWQPGPVAPVAGSPLPPALVIAQPVLEPSPYAPAVLPARSSDVSELLDSFYVTGAAEERELRSALKEMAGLELTPLPHPLIEEG